MKYRKIIFFALITFFLAGIASAADPSLVGWWKMDETSGNVVADSSGNGNNGTMGTADTWLAGGGINFAGSEGNSGIVFANNGADLIADMGLTSQVTISYVATWDAYVAGANYPYDGRNSANLRVLSAECPTGNHLLDHFGGTNSWAWEAFNDQDSRFIFTQSNPAGTWGTFVRITTTVNFNTGDYKLYIDDKLYASETGKVGSFAGLATFTLGKTLYAEMEGSMKEFRIYNRELTENEIKDFFVQAYSPSPNGSSSFTSWPLSWASGIYAASHDVYFGTNFNDVDNADTSSPLFMGNQTENTYDVGSLAAGTYFWRIDEVNDIDVWKGQVWSFEILPTRAGPVFWLKMDETSGNVAHDSSGNGNDGTIGSADVWMNGSGLNFDGGSYGASGIVFTGNGAALVADMALTNQVTVSYWATWDAYVNGANYPFDGRNAGNARILAAECPTGNHLLNHFGGYGAWAWEAFNEFDARFIFAHGNPSTKTWGDMILITATMDFTTGSYNLYVDGQLYVSESGTTGSFAGLATFTVGRTLYGEMEGNMADFRIYNYAFTALEVRNLLVKANSPSPSSGSQSFTSQPLSWTSGLYADSHDVYFGTDFNDVNDATTVSPVFMGNQTENTYDVGTLAGGTYYWRIDEVDSLGVSKGDVWSFVIIVMPDPQLWLKMDGPTTGQAARFVKDSSANGMNGTMGSSDVWKAAPGLGSGSVIDFDGGYWGASGIQFDGNDVNDLFATNFSDKVTVSYWVTYNGKTNYDGRFSGKGAQYPYDGRDSAGIRLLSSESPTGDWLLNHCGGNGSWGWFAFKTIDGTPTGTPLSTSIFRGGATWGDYQRWTFTANLTTGSLKLYIDNELYLSDSFTPGGISMAGIRSFYVGRDPQTYGCFEGDMSDFRLYNTVLEPEYIAQLVGDYPEVPKLIYPANESTGNPLAFTAEWKKGKGAVLQDGYFGTDQAAIENADTSSPYYLGQQSTTTFDVNGLELGKTYYWRVDQLDANGDLIKKGPVWQFSTIEYIMVDDFESYDNESNFITDVWTDVLGNGDMQVALVQDPNLSPINSMHLRYHTPYDPYYAIAARSFSPAQDWTTNGVKVLTIHYYGDAMNFGLPVFVTIGDGTNVAVDVNTLATGWSEINVSLPAIAAAGVDLSNVTNMKIGFGDGTDKGMIFQKWDNIYIDDIALYPPKCVPSESGLQADITADCVVNYADLDALAMNWLLAGYTVGAAPSVSNTGLVLRYEFENNTTDSVAANNGTLQNVGVAANYAAGHTGQSIHFGATSASSGSNMIVPAAAFASLDDEVTFSFWLKKDEAAPTWYQCLFTGHGIASDYKEIFLSYAPAEQTNMQTTFTCGSDGSIDWQSYEGIGFIQEQPFNYTTWHHYAMVKNVKLGYMSIYVDGQLKAFRSGRIKPITGCDKFILGSTTSFTGSADSGFAKGSFDDFRVYNRALSHAEVLKLAGQLTATVPFSMFGVSAGASDINNDEAVDFKDYSILANEWLIESLWP